ncbi:MAG: TetR/AcrR family transcriptional regulator [Firmicutes bacterium]|nr:TetR/AcrR family transcriptional regulator [Bacillota bacterium]
MDILESDSRTRILDVALQLFDQQGYAGTSMEAIRKAAGFRTKSSLYAHFPSKQSLSEALLERILAEETAALAPCLKPESQATLDDVLNLAERLVTWGLTHQAAYRFCFLQWHGDTPRPPRTDAAVEVAPQWAIAVLSRLQAEGAPLRAMDPAFLVNACYGLINQVIVSSPPGLSPDRIAELARQTRWLCGVIMRA